MAHTQAREFNTALNDARHLQQLARADSDREEEAWALYEQGRAFFMLEQPDAALKYTLAALALRPTNPITLCDVHYELGSIYTTLRRNDEAIAAMGITLPLCRQLGRHDLLANELVAVATLQAFKNDPTLAAPVDDEIAEARRELPLISRLAFRAATKERLAELLWYRGDHDGAKAEAQDACADYTAAARLPEAARLRTALVRWQAGASPYSDAEKTN